MLPPDVRTVLLVDDEPRLRAVLSRTLSAEGFVCREAGSGVEALREMERDPAPLVISDIRMPEMDGVTLLREIMARWPDTAVILVTAVAEVESAVACLQLGALDYLAKPFQLDEVRARVYQAVDKRRLLLENRSYHLELEQRVRAQARRIEELFLEGVTALAVALEAKDAYLRGHSIRVAEYSLAMARHLGLDGDRLEALALGAHLHDIGKIGVREEVLHKPSRLTEAEYLHIMEHPAIGARILAPLLKDSPTSLAVVRSHHERLDGKGLPDGLRGDAIGMEVRIATVADAFDAMTSVRPYRGSLSVAQALDQLHEGRDSQFDPAVVDAFQHVFPRDRLPIATPGEFRLPRAGLEAASA
jgi:putative nucleotidyltransferase with HDIG domain